MLRRIDAAFDGARQPLTEEELAPASIEAPYAIEHFFGKSRADVETQWFPASLYMEDFQYMTDAAVLYYLPPVLRIMLAKPSSSELWIFLHGFLRGIRGTYPDSSLTGMSAAQHDAIADWAEHLAAAFADSHWMSKFSAEAQQLAGMYRRS